MPFIRRPILAALGALTVLLSTFWAAGDVISAQADDGGASDAPTKEISNALRNPSRPESLLVNDPAIGIQSLTPQFADGEAEIGDQADWVALNDFGGFYYLKTFELRALNDTGEIWIAVGEGTDPNGDPDGVLGLDFPAGDCRNDGVRNIVSDAQAQYLLDQFTDNIKATDEAWFGEPNFRDGSAGLIPAPSASGKQVVLVDNVRDDNFYDTNNANTNPYIAGFFTTAMDFFHNRNVMTVDGFDWLHRTTADPPHAPSADPCTTAQARPFLYESTFAHEYQHLIHSDYDPDELNWVNEGMSDLAMLLTGYSDPSKHINQKGNDSHPMNYQGWASVTHPDWNPIPRPSGPENSLTLWEDQGPAEVLADYGFAYSFMVYMLDHGYGMDFFLAWQHNPLNGIAGLNDTLATFQGGGRYGHGQGQSQPDTFMSLFEDMTVSTLTDAYIDAGAHAKGEKASAISSKSLNSTVYFSPNAYASPGAPPWGSDYIPLGAGDKLKNLKFDGTDVFTFPGGNDWIIDADGYFTSPDEAGDTVYPDGLDSSIAHEVTVPAAPATLTFEHWYQTELNWDFGFVQVLDNGVWVSLPCTGTTTDHDPSADPTIAANVPGYSGPTDNPSDPTTAGTPAAPLAASCDLSAYAGQTTVIAFRMMSDSSVRFDGWHVRNVAVNGTPVDATPGDISDWDNETFFVPVDLGFQLTLVGLDGRVDQYGFVRRVDDVVVVRPHLGPGFTYNLSNADRNALKHSQRVVAIVTGIPSDETLNLYFPYSLRVNGQQRADGAGLP